MKIYEFDVIPSTNEEARRYLLEGHVDPAVFVAQHQTAGRGRLGREWKDEPGKNLLMSIAMPNPPTSELPLLGMAAAVIVGEYLSSLSLAWEAKWPNDVLVKGKKIAGILPEAIWSDNLIGVVVGIGLNVNQEAFPPEVKATSLKLELGMEIPLEQPLMYIIYRFKNLLGGEIRLPDMVSTFKARFPYLGKTVMVVSEGERIEGTAADILADGTLLLDTPQGEMQLRWGEVSLR
ncbi:biotin--[acetyl-CoA-carboxylase] ligase [Coprothermobacteraceae bacterium]|nr:biotin--[acetyl-CoA-carboxylase] ligase [Coprothermobacteraceae bacterium]